MENSRHIVHEGKVLREEINDSGYRHLVPTVVATETVYPGFTDPAKRIPWSLFRQIIAFMEWGAAEMTSEVLVILFINDAGTWEAWAPPQKLLGMSIERLPEDPDYAKQRKAFGGFDEIGSVHHHMGGDSSPSQQDIKDESARRSGYHLTMGGMGTNQRNFHFRVWSNSIMHVVPFAHVVAPDASLDNNEVNMCAAATYFKFTDDLFPEYWKKNCKKPVVEERQRPFVQQIGGLGSAVTVPRTLTPPGSASPKRSRSSGSATTKPRPVTPASAIERIAQMFDEAGIVRTVGHISEDLFQAWEESLSQYENPLTATLGVADVRRDAAEVDGKIRESNFDPDELSEMTLKEMEEDGLDPEQVRDMSQDAEYAATWDLMDAITDELVQMCEAAETPPEPTLFDHKNEIFRALAKGFGASEIPLSIREPLLNFFKKGLSSSEKITRTMAIKSCIFLTEKHPCAIVVKNALTPLLDK